MDFTILTLVSVFFGLCDSKQGIVDEIHIGQRYLCSNVGKMHKSVRSELQCIHWCLRQEKCGFINYIEESSKKTVDRICEVHIIAIEKS